MPPYSTVNRYLPSKGNLGQLWANARGNGGAKKQSLQISSRVLHISGRVLRHYRQWVGWERAERVSGPWWTRDHHWIDLFSILKNYKEGSGKEKTVWTSPGGQWLRFCTLTAGGTGSIPVSPGQKDPACCATWLKTKNTMDMPFLFSQTR